MRTPEEVIADLAPKYTTWKSSEKSKEKLRKEFLKAVTAALAEGELAEKVVTVEAPDKEGASEYAEKKFPLWKVDEIRETPDSNGYFDIILIENPEFLPFTIEYDGRIWGRQIRSSSVYVDNETLQQDDPELWLQVSEIPMRDTLSEIIVSCGIDPSGVNEILETFVSEGKLTRTLRSLDDLDSEVMARLQEYIYEGKPSLTFPAPTNVSKD